MRHFKTFIPSAEHDRWMAYPILSQTVADYLKKAVALVSDGGVLREKSTPTSTASSLSSVPRPR